MKTSMIALISFPGNLHKKRHGVAAPRSAASESAWIGSRLYTGFSPAVTIRHLNRSGAHAMPITGKWIFTASMDVDPDKEALFNEVYDTEHVPHLSKVPGVISATRVKTHTLRVTIGGETKK